MNNINRNINQLKSEVMRESKKNAEKKKKMEKK